MYVHRKGVIMLPFIPLLMKLGLPYLAEKVMTKGKEVVVDLVKEKTGFDLGELHNASSEDVKKLKGVDNSLKKEIEANRHIEKVKQMDIDLEVKRHSLHNANTADARSLTKTAIGSNDTFVRRFTYYFITFWSVVSVVYFGFASFAEIPDANRPMVQTILGFMLGTAVSTIFNFLLGSSDKISKNLNKPVKPGAKK